MVWHILCLLPRVCQFLLNMCKILPNIYKVEVLQREETDSCGLYWVRDHGQDGIAWRVLCPNGSELAIYDSECIARDVINQLNTLIYEISKE